MSPTLVVKRKVLLLVQIGQFRGAGDPHVVEQVLDDLGILYLRSFIMFED